MVSVLVHPPKLSPALPAALGTLISAAPGDNQRKIVLNASAASQRAVEFTGSKEEETPAINQ